MRLHKSTIRMASNRVQRSAVVLHAVLPLLFLALLALAAFADEHVVTTQFYDDAVEGLQHSHKQSAKPDSALFTQVEQEPEERTQVLPDEEETGIIPGDTDEEDVYTCEPLAEETIADAAERCFFSEAHRMLGDYVPGGGPNQNTHPGGPP